MNKIQMVIEFYSFWGGFDRTLIAPYFEKLFEGLEYDVIQVWSIFGGEPYTLNVNPRILTVQWSGEPVCKNINKYNVNLIARKSDKNIIPTLLALTDTFVHKNVDKLTQKRVLQKKTRFCNFIVSNGGPVERQNFFLELSKRKHVDSCGRFLTNWKGPPAPPFSTSEYHDFLGSWKFMICFESNKVDYYVTEKLTNAYLGGCIPIYWGCNQIKEIVNEKAILLLEENTPEAVNKLIDRIMELENDEKLYEEMFNEPLFKNNKLSNEFNVEYLRSEISKKIKTNLS